jgi:DNA topoisomerase-1
MVIAQQLYEAGYITYMRTDSVVLSDFAIHTAKEEIEKLFGKEYSKTRKYISKTKGAQEAHEAIRPTIMANQTIPGDTFAKRLYELIWKRTIASQMSDAEIEKTVINIPISNRSEKFVATGEVVQFQGFLKVYIESKDEEDEDIKGWLPPVSNGDLLNAKEIKATQRYSQPPARYTEASLVKKLEELGIGRPSTYAPTITTIQKREYVIKNNRVGSEREYFQLILKKGEITDTGKIEKFGSEKDKLFPTDIGIVVNEYLQNNFEDIMDYGFTAEVEKEFDEIAEGRKVWQNMIDQFYQSFHASIENAISHSSKASGERLLGQDPKTLSNVYAKLGKYGPMVQIGENYEDKKPRYARMKSTQFIDTITLEEALDLFKLPRTLGEFEGNEVSIGMGKFGPYIKYGKSYVSFPKDEEPTEIELDRSIELIKEKIQQDKDRAPRLLGSYNDSEIHVAIGKFGPYIKYNDQNMTLEKGMNPGTMTLADAINLIENIKTKNVIASFKESEQVKVVNGRYGAYITNGTDNFKIPKGTVAENLTYADCMEIIKNTAPTAKKRFPRKK